MTSVDLLVPELAPHDATGTHTMLLRDLLVEMGADVRIVAQTPSPLDEDVMLIRAWKPSAELTILQHGIGSLVAEAVIDHQASVVLNYHNITPLEFVEPWNPDRIAGLRWGRVQLDQLAPLCQLAVADSDYNAAELRAAAYRDVVVSPVLWRSRRDQIVRSVGDEPVVLFVGRVAPNKCHEDLLAAFAMVHEEHRQARLILVGSAGSSPYHAALEAYAQRLEISAAVEFVGEVTDEELLTHYGRADVFVCLSEHEGFCVPVVEAMGAGIPVIGYRAAAVPETVADAGLVLADKSPSTVAAAIDRVLTDTELRDHLALRGMDRADDFDLANSRRQMRTILEPLLATP